MLKRFASMFLWICRVFAKVKSRSAHMKSHRMAENEKNKMKQNNNVDISVNSIQGSPFRWVPPCWMIPGALIRKWPIEHGSLPLQIKAASFVFKRKWENIVVLLYVYTILDHEWIERTKQGISKNRKRKDTGEKESVWNLYNYGCVVSLSCDFENLGEDLRRQTWHY